MTHNNIPKKILSVFLSVLLILTILPFAGVKNTANAASVQNWVTCTNCANYRATVNLIINGVSSGTNNSVDGTYENNITQYAFSNPVYQKSSFRPNSATILVDRCLYSSLDQMNINVQLGQFTIHSNTGIVRWGIQIFGGHYGSPRTYLGNGAERASSNGYNYYIYQNNATHQGILSAETGDGNLWSDSSTSAGRDLAFGPYNWYLRGDAPAVGESAYLDVAGVCVVMAGSGNYQMLTEWTHLTITGTCSHSKTKTLVKNNNGTHSYRCDVCGQTVSTENCSFSQATCTSAATCSVCGATTGTTLPHSYTVLQYDGENHWYKCANCSATNTRSAHSYTVIQSDENTHWYKCSGCPEISEKVYHAGGVVNVAQKPVCEACGREYDTVKKSTLSLSGIKNGAAADNISGLGTVDLYVNGECVANDVSDFSYSLENYESTYEIKDIKTASGYAFDESKSSPLKGVVTGNTDISLAISSAHTLTVSEATANAATFDLYVNNKKTASGVTSFSGAVPDGAKYEIRELKSNAGCRFSGNVSDLSGTMPSSSKSVSLAFATTYSASGSVSTGATLNNGTVYSVTSDTTLSSGSGSGLNVAGGATAVLYIAQGVTLTVKGKDGSGTSGGYAGINLPSNSTLIVTGGGTLNVTGGNSGQSQAGGTGGAGWLSVGDNRFQGGTGGKGGDGAGGAGAGIGGNGGGGAGGPYGPGGPSDSCDLYNDHNGNGGYGGSNGGGGGSMGTLYVIGNMTVNAAGGAGAGGAGGGAGGACACDHGSGWTHNYTAGGGGGGGGGGSTDGGSAIGGGSGGAGSGGSGGSGGTYTKASWNDHEVNRGGPGGGAEGGYGGGYGDNHGHDVNHTSGGGGGGYRGGTGGSGTFYKSSTATVGSRSANGTVETLAQITFTEAYDTQGADISQGTAANVVCYGTLRPASVTVPQRKGYTFAGYYTAPNGGGAQVYNASGARVDAKKIYDVYGSSILYAKWSGGATVLFDTASADYTAVTSVTAAENAAMPVLSELPVCKDRSFLGYFTQPGGKGTKYYNANGTSAHVMDLTGGTVLYPHWSAPSGNNTIPASAAVPSSSQGTFSITYMGNGGLANGKMKTTATSSAAAANSFTKTGYTFICWNTLKSGKGTDYMPGDYIKAPASGTSVTLYAKWAAKETVVYDFSILTPAAPDENSLRTGGDEPENNFVSENYSIVPGKLNGSSAINNGFSYVDTGYEREWRDVTAVPASNVLYEETALGYASATGTKAGWTACSDTSVSITGTDGANRITGYTNAYSDSTPDSFSAGSVMKASVSQTAKTSGKADFTFTGDRFDFISACGLNTGCFTVKVTDSATNKIAKTFIIDTFIDDAACFTDGLIRQVPVCQFAGNKSTYNVEITAVYLTSGGAVKYSNGTSDGNSADSDTACLTDVKTDVIAQLDSMGIIIDDPDALEFVFFDEDSVLNGGAGNTASASAKENRASSNGTAASNGAGSGSVDCYIDGVRIYQPLENNEYIAAEQNVTYFNVVNELNNDSDFAGYYETVAENGKPVQINQKKYHEGAPANEVYITGGNAVSFTLDSVSKTSSELYIGLRAAKGEPDAEIRFGSAGSALASAVTVTSGTEMYYKIPLYALNTDGTVTVVITNASSDSVLAVNNARLKNAGIRSNASNESAKTVRFLMTMAPVYVPAEPEEETTAGWTMEGFIEEFTTEAETTAAAGTEETSTEEAETETAEQTEQTEETEKTPEKENLLLTLIKKLIAFIRGLFK